MLNSVGQHPAIYPHGGTYSVVFKNNHYGGRDRRLLFRSELVPGPLEPERFILGPEQYFVRNSVPTSPGVELPEHEHAGCTRNPDGTITCVSDIRRLNGA